MARDNRGFDEGAESTVTADEAAILRSLHPAGTPFELAGARWRDAQSPTTGFAVLIADANYDRRILLVTLTSALEEIRKLRSSR